MKKVDQKGGYVSSTLERFGESHLSKKTRGTWGQKHMIIKLKG